MIQYNCISIAPSPSGKASDSDSDIRKFESCWGNHKKTNRYYIYFFSYNFIGDYMNIRNKINDYIVDKEYKIIIKNNYVNVINYEEIKDFNDNKIEIINKKNNITKIIGENLIISKMQDDEVLIKGKIKNIEL